MKLQESIDHKGSYEIIQSDLIDKVVCSISELESLKDDIEEFIKLEKEKNENIFEQ